MTKLQIAIVGSDEQACRKLITDLTIMLHVDAKLAPGYTISREYGNALCDVGEVGKRE